MIVTAHMRQLVQACFPETQKEAIELWHNIRPIRFGDRHQWDAPAGAAFATLASYQIPEDAAYLAILKTECFVYVNGSTAPGFRNFSPPPTGSGAQWFYNAAAGQRTPLSSFAAMHVITNSSDLLIAKGGNLIALTATLDSPPTADVWFICTTVYAYHISAVIADRIGTGEALLSGGNTS
jgi:hypothetical protein